MAGMRSNVSDGKAKRRKVLFNWDGGPLAFAEYPMSKEQFLGYVFSPLEGSQVDTILWCTGATLVDYPSKLGNTFGDLSPELIRKTPHQYRHHLNAKRFIERGEEPLKTITEEGHRQGKGVFASFRLNDTHDSHPFRDKPVDLTQLAPVKRENPHWMLGHEARRNVPTAFNYALKEVRDWWLERVCEPFTKYDLDGIELDFLRSQHYFRDKQEYRQKYLLTDWLQRVRARLQDLGNKRGKPIEVAVRVDETLEASLLDGLDVEAWVNEGLFDILVVGQPGYDADIPAYKRLIGDGPISIYPCVYGWAAGQFFAPKPDEEIRADAACCFLQGADGIYCFNMFPVVNRLSDEQCVSTRIFKELGDPEALHRKNKIYHVGTGRLDPPWYAYSHLKGLLPVELHVTEKGWGPVLKLLVADDIRRDETEGRIASLKLRLRFQNVAPDDRSEISLNGTTLKVLEYSYPLVLKAHGTALVDSAGQRWSEIAVAEGIVVQGWNEIQVTLLERTPLRCPLILAEVLLSVDYQDG